MEEYDDTATSEFMEEFEVFPLAYVTSDDKKVLIFKIVLVGASGVGKSSILDRYVEGAFVPKPEETIAVDFRIKTLEVSGNIFKFQFWDVPGGEQMRALTQEYLEDSHVVLFTFSFDDESSFERVEDELKGFDDFDTHIYLVGNKCDLLPDDEKSSSDARAKWDARINDLRQRYRKLTYYGVSAKNNMYVQELFDNIIFILEQNLPVDVSDLGEFEDMKVQPRTKKKMRKCWGCGSCFGGRRKRIPTEI